MKEIKSLSEVNYKTVKTCGNCNYSETEFSGIGQEFLVCKKFDACIDDNSVCDNHKTI